MDDSAFRSFVDEVRRRTDLIALIEPDTALRKVGSVHKGRSPFNRDSDPSFVVWESSQQWRDYSGGGDLGGDCFDYVQRRDGVSFWDALLTLADRAGVRRPDWDPDGPEAKAHGERRAVEDVLGLAATYYETALPDDVRQAWYRDRYGLTDETIERFRLGYADGGLFDHLVRERAVPVEDALASGLLVRLKGGRIVDFFQGRLVFPYVRGGHVTYFAARQTEHTPDEDWERDAKYKKLLTRSDKHPYVSAQLRNDTIFNEGAARRATVLLITEGLTDCISAEQAGVACISPATVRFRVADHPRLLDLTRNTSRVVICNDNEVNAAGEKGALATAMALYMEGRDVRMAEIPRPVGRDKIDVNELVKEQGPDALKAVLDVAVRVPERLLASIPADTPPLDLPEAITPLRELLAGASALEREEYVKAVRRRFGVSAAAAKELLPKGEPRKANESGDAADLPAGWPPGGAQAIPFRGDVWELDGVYLGASAAGTVARISTFAITPRRWITTEAGDVLVGDVACREERVLPGVVFPPSCWKSRAALLGALPTSVAQWTGGDENVQGLLALLSRAEVPRAQGTTRVGLAHVDGGWVWVSPSGCLAPGSAGSEAQVEFVADGSTLAARTNYRLSLPWPEVQGLAARVLPDILSSNTPDVVLPAVGWFVAAPLRERIVEVVGHFPTLWIWGAPGSGKSSIAVQVYWPLLGVPDAEAYASGQKEFTLLRLLSSSSGVPVILDEYKPGDMGQEKLDALHRAVRRLYSGESEERGRSDLTVASYRLSAPLCVCGESRPTEQALLERIVTVRPRKVSVDVAEHAEAFKRLKAEPLQALAPVLIRWLLGRDVRADLDAARRSVADALGERSVPVRVRDNLVVVAAGIAWLQGFAEACGVTLPPTPVERAVAAIVEDVVEEGGEVRSGLGQFLETLASLAHQQHAVDGVHFHRLDESRVAIHLRSAHDVYLEHARRVLLRGEVIDRTALRRQFAENHGAGGFVLALDLSTSFGTRNNKCRAVVIDVGRASEHLDLDGLLTPSPPPDAYDEGLP